MTQGMVSALREYGGMVSKEMGNIETLKEK